MQAKSTVRRTRQDGGAEYTDVVRERVEPGIYKRGGKYEVVYRDSSGKQRREVVGPTLAAAQHRRKSIEVKRGDAVPVVAKTKVKFGPAADRYLSEEVSGLRATTQEGYRIAVESHLRPRWGNRRLDSITTDMAAKLVCELRDAGLAESSITKVLRVANRVFKFAKRRMSWHGENPIAALDKSERPKVTATAKGRIFEARELDQTIAAAHEPYKTLFVFAAATGARQSECLGLVWSDLDVWEPDDASVTFAFQASRKGERVALKTDESCRTVPLPRSLVVVLLEHKARTAAPTDPDAFVFATRTGRALEQRNVTRELDRAKTAATDEHGEPTFPVLHEDSPVPKGSVPTFHGLRHTAASRAFQDGDRAEEVAWLLGHKNANVTRAVYLHEIRSAEAKARQRAKIDARFGSILAAADGDTAQTHAAEPAAEVVDLQQVRDTRQ